MALVKIQSWLCLLFSQHVKNSLYWCIYKIYEIQKLTCKLTLQKIDDGLMIQGFIIYDIQLTHLLLF